MITIAFAGKLKKMENGLSRGARWCYLGKDIALRAKVSAVLGEEKRLYLKDRLHKVSLDMRQPYLDFVGDLGKDRPDRLNWWAGRFASKSHFQTDFFLLVCYKVLAASLIEANGDGEELVIFVEDPWLFTDLKDENSGKSVIFLGTPDLFFKKAALLLRGIAYRKFLVLWFVVAWAMARYYHGAKKPKALDCGGPAVCILNPSETRTFKGGRYVDNFKPGLSELYEKKGIAYFYLYLFNFPLSTAKYLRSNKDILWPLIFDVKFSDVIKAAFTRWRIGTPEGAKVFAIKGCGAAKLLEREEWVEFSSMGFNVRLVLFKTLSAFFKKGWCRSAIYVFENQPWEKMLCMASAANNIKAFGYQHSSIWKQYLSQFIGEGESDIAPLPYRIITSSGYFAGLYKEGGIPDGKLAVGGAWRYAHCSDQAARKVPSAGSVAAKPVVMVALPIDRFIAKSMLESVLREVKTKGLGAAADFWIKPHPGFLKQDNDMVKAIVSGYPIVSKPFNELLDEVDIVISSASTSGLEAFLYGRKAVAYVAENLLASDPLLDIKDPNVLIWYEGEDLDAGFFRPKSLNSEGMKNKYFDNINQDVWLECANA